jgi:hypothetical protein
MRAGEEERNVLRVRRGAVSGAALIALGIATIAPSPTLAAGAMPIDAAQTEPAPSQSVVAGAASLSFKVVAPACTTTEMFVEVASRETYDSNNSLADSVQSDYIALTQTSPGVFEGQTNAKWLKTPATYFWQAYTVANCGGVFDYTLEYVSQTRELVVTAPPPPPAQPAAPEAAKDSKTLSVAQASAEVPKVILKRTRKTARGLKRRCARRGTGNLIVYCTVSWTDNTKYSYTGSMRLARNDDGTLSSRFDGRRAQRACLKKGRGARCYKKWTFS